MTKFILITQRVITVESYNERRDCLDQNWNKFIFECGFIPFICPNNLIIVKSLLKKIEVSGIILSGGNNLTKYDGKASERDKLENYLIEYSIKKHVPLVGVCRGMQVILDYFNINLVNVRNHIKTTHNLYYKNSRMIVNSFHSLGAYETNNEIYVECRAEDGVLEKIRHSTYNIHGIMWHPERNAPFNDNDIDFFKEILGKGVTYESDNISSWKGK